MLGVRRHIWPGAAGATRRRWKFAWVALLALPFLALGGVAACLQQADPGVDLTVLRDDGHGHCTVRWTDPLDGRERQGPFACDSGRAPILRDQEYGWEASSWPWRGDLYNAEGAGTPMNDVILGATLAGSALLCVAALGGAVRIVRRRRTVSVTKPGDHITASATHGRTRATASPLVRCVLLTAGAAVALGVSGGLFGIALPDARQREKDFRGAVPCPSAATGAATAATDCLSTERFTVEKVRIRRGKNASYTADLTGPDSATARRVRFDDDVPLLRRLHPGDAVRGTVWRRGVVAVTSEDGRTRQSTSDDPTDDPSGIAAVGVVLAVLGSGLAIAGGTSAYRMRARRTA